MLTDAERKILLSLARGSIELIVNEHKRLLIQLADYTPALREQGASFVTLTIHNNLRGCIGALEPYQPLVQDVCEHAAAAATDDFRFPPVSSSEIPLLQIEISRLTLPQQLDYQDPEELLRKLHPGIDGVILKDGNRRATFLPQVWEKIPDPSDFLSHLCEKMWAPLDLWRRRSIQVFTYQVEEFAENH